MIGIRQAVFALLHSPPSRVRDQSNNLEKWPTCRRFCERRGASAVTLTFDSYLHRSRPNLQVAEGTGWCLPAKKTQIIRPKSTVSLKF